MNLKQNKGIGLSDAIIAVTIFVIFTSIIVLISSNIYLQSNFIKRNEQATNYIVEIFEYAEGYVFDDLNTQQLVDYINNKYDNAEAIIGLYNNDEQNPRGYKIYINVDDKYQNYIKQIDITVIYKLGKNVKTVSMGTLINK